MIETAFVDGAYMKNVMMEVNPTNIVLEFGYSKNLLAKVKSMRGAKWLGGHKNNPVPNPRKAWQIDNCPRNDFQIQVLQGKNPYAKYDVPLDLNALEFTRPLYEHQKEMAVHMWMRKQSIICGEMGVGKSLAAIEAMEKAMREWGIKHPWWVAPKTALTSVKLECRKWKAQIEPHFCTYDELKKTLANWSSEAPPPRVVIFDESSRVKTPTAQRSQAAAYLADEMRKHWGDECLIVLMSGSPAPKSPVDWYWQAEIARPGFFQEGTVDKFKYNLGIFEKISDVAGVTFPKFKSWRVGKTHLCDECGESAEHFCHTVEMTHPFVPMRDEVSRLSRRMRGFCLVKLKKDCLDLPEKQYRQIRIKPTPELLRAARLVQNSSRNAIECLTRHRELSDGFQYLDVAAGKEPCCGCKGVKTIATDEAGLDLIACPFCHGTGEQNIVVRETQNVSAPKIAALKALLNEEFEDENRMVIYSGFTASIDLVEEAMKKEGWQTIRVDGRGWNSDVPVAGQLELLEAFQDTYQFPQKICFIGHPGSAGMGITLTASKAIIYYSNDFNFESRIQSEDRIHRAGMDVNRGAMIIDLFHLPTDELVFKNLQGKKEVQGMSIGDIAVAMEQPIDESHYTNAA